MMGTNSTTSIAHFNALAITHWQQFSNHINSSDKRIEINGRDLTIPMVLSVARHGRHAVLDVKALGKVAESSQALLRIMNKGEIIYGVDTGYGGSADTRPGDMYALQRNLITFLNCGVLRGTARADPRPSWGQHPLPSDYSDTANLMPESWVRSTMLIRLNSLISGASGTRVSTVKSLAALLEHDIVPIIPLRGSISASGDLSPLSYVAAALQGRRTSKVWISDDGGTRRRLVGANEALRKHGIFSTELAPKEGLSLVNGTAVSAAVGSLAMHDMMLLSSLAQIITALSVEALAGTDESFDPFISEIRPHQGQLDAAHNMFAFLKGSRLVNHNDGSDGSLRQDRYSVRTAPQWIGPIIEDLTLSYQQITVELNSVTDNPLIDSSTDRVLNGGNFQARAITSAMEKLRQGCQGLGRMLFAQCTEIVNPTLSHGLPPNLVIDEPSESYLFKGTDIMLAALQSELGFLANPVGTHVLPAEMGNQSLNSLALISGRYTLDAISILSQISATALVMLCQALDIRAMNKIFNEAIEPKFKTTIRDIFVDFVTIDVSIKALQSEAWTVFSRKFYDSTNMDSHERFEEAVEAVQPALLRSLKPDTEALIALKTFTATSARDLREIYLSTRDWYYHNHNATPHLGGASKIMYDFVRNKLKVPFLRNDVLEQSCGPKESASRKLNGHSTNDINGHGTDGINGHHEHESAIKDDEMTLGSLLTDVYDSIRTGEIWPSVAECLKLAEDEKATENSL